VCLSVCLSVFLFIFCVSCFCCSHARCSGCKSWKIISDETWTELQLRHNRCEQRQLFCKVCSLQKQSQGTTARDSKLKNCETCNFDTGRKQFAKSSLDNKNRNPSNVLICLECAEREKGYPEQNGEHQRNALFLPMLGVSTQTRM
jgi:hypothetical protein